VRQELCGETKGGDEIEAQHFNAIWEIATKHLVNSGQIRIQDVRRRTGSYTSVNRSLGFTTEFASLG
jgi:hypothetical protein